MSILDWKLPGPEEERTYRIGGPFQAPIIVKITGVPNCLWCETPVTGLSCDGPLICGDCDMGRNHDGTKWSDEDYKRLRKNYERRIEEYRTIQKTCDHKWEPTNAFLAILHLQQIWYCLKCAEEQMMEFPR